jgi:hypothetical protein
MNRPLAESRTSLTLAVAIDRLKREFSELLQLREAVAEAERTKSSRAREPSRCPRSPRCLPATLWASQQVFGNNFRNAPTRPHAAHRPHANDDEIGGDPPK